MRNVFGQFNLVWGLSFCVEIVEYDDNEDESDVDFSGAEDDYDEFEDTDGEDIDGETLHNMMSELDSFSSDIGDTSNKSKNGIDLHTNRVISEKNIKSYRNRLRTFLIEAKKPRPSSLCTMIS